MVDKRLAKMLANQWIEEFQNLDESDYEEYISSPCWELTPEEIKELLWAWEEEYEDFIYLTN